MRLDEYKWSHNPRGLHNAIASRSIDVGRLIQMKMGWVKLVSVDRDYVKLIGQMLGNNITPIVRVWRPRYGASTYTPDMLYAWQEYYNAGVRWFEYYNEPNLEIEWPEGQSHPWHDTAGTIIPICQNWLVWAETIIAMGGYPAFPALAEQTIADGDVTNWLWAMINYLGDNYYDRFRVIAENGLWCATHPYYYNHFYQESAGPLSARQPDAQRAAEGGWHFEYPYDPITQASNPGLTAISGGPDYPRGDPIGLAGMGRAFMEKFAEIFGGGAIPVVGTEGGITPAPVPGQTTQLDNRFPGYTWSSHAEATVAAFNWIAEQGPPWMFGLTLWKEDEYFEGPHGGLPAVQRLSETMPVYKSVPPLKAIEGPGKRFLTVQQGPGPIHGEADYHFLLIAPGFNSNWFFSEARDYWIQFRPAVVTSPDFIPFIPYTKSLAITVLSTPELAEYMTQQIKERWANVWFDLIVADKSDSVAAILRDRAANRRRFG